jgi:hypothetical protein
LLSGRREHKLAEKENRYRKLASSKTPALIIYLLDVSASMVQPMGDRRRIDVVMESLEMIIKQMIFRSTKGGTVMPRYRVAMLAYSDHVYDLLDGVKSVAEILEYGIPELSPMLTTETAKVFNEAEKMIKDELGRMEECPAPLVCHLTDGEYTGEDPEPVARRLMELSVPDGNVLLENIFISEDILEQPIKDAHLWPGILPDTGLKSEYAYKLQRMSSNIPDSYRMIMLEHNFHLSQDAIMLFPAMNKELVAMGFQMSAATPVSRS